MNRIFTTTISLLFLCASVMAQSSENALQSVRQIIDEVREELAPDSRQAIFNIKAFNDPDGVLTIEGTVSDSLLRRSIISRIAQTDIDYKSKITDLPTDQWAIVKLSVASLRTSPKHSAEMSTQAIMGTPLRLLEKSDSWWRVQMPDGYISWIPASSISEKSKEQMDEWRQSHRFIVTGPTQIMAYKTAESTSPRDVMTDLVAGSIVAIPSSIPHLANGRLEIELPDGRKAYVEASALKPIEEWAAQPFNANVILDAAYSIMGTPYLWGGASSKAIDCSGLVKMSYFANGIILMRDASQQAKTGKNIKAADWRLCRPADLLFFGNKSTGKVNHVGIYDHNGQYIHSSGRVRVNSVDPEADDYLTRPFLHATRIDGMEETQGITRARNHPWYF